MVIGDFVQQVLVLLAGRFDGAPRHLAAARLDIIAAVPDALRRLGEEIEPLEFRHHAPQRNMGVNAAADPTITAVAPTIATACQISARLKRLSNSRSALAGSPISGSASPAP